jgi:peptidoglycan/xylan/chitin deacetylase (PgdA/CDA1 family)
MFGKFGPKATFYVPATNRKRAGLAPADPRAISGDFEIGAHTFSHRSFDPETLEEIADGKRWLEGVLGTPVISYCDDSYLEQLRLGSAAITAVAEEARGVRRGDRVDEGGLEGA